MKKRNVLLLAILLLAGIIYYPNIKERLQLLGGETATKENTISSMAELEERVLDTLEQGKEELNVYLDGIGVKELETINANLDGYYGYVNSYYIAKWPKNGLYQTRLNIELSDNYYAYQYLRGNDVKEMPDTALQLAEKVDAVLKEIITPDMNDFEKEKAIHDYVIKQGEYGFLTGSKKEDSYNSKGILLEGKGVCSSYSESMQLLLSLAGVESKIILGKADVEHSWNLVKLDGNWYHVDATWDDPVPDEEGRVLYNYFNVPDQLIGKTHTWNPKLYEKADSYEENYYNKKGDLCSSYSHTKERIIDGIKKKEKKLQLLLTGENAQEYSYNFVLQYDSVKSVKWKNIGESPCLVLEMTLEYQS